MGLLLYRLTSLLAKKRNMLFYCYYYSVAQIYQIRSTFNQKTYFTNTY